MDTQEITWCDTDAGGKVSVRGVKYKRYEDGNKVPIDKDRAYMPIDPSEAFPGGARTVETLGQWEELCKEVGKLAFQRKKAAEAAIKQVEAANTRTTLESLEKQILQLQARLEKIQAPQQ